MVVQKNVTKKLHNKTSVLLDYNFVVKKIMKLHLQHNSSICIHIYLTTLADSTYELELDNEEGSSEAHVNRVEITEDPNSTLEET